MAQPALRIYEIDLPRTDKPDANFHLTIYSPNENAEMKGCVIAVHGTGENANRYRQMAKEALVPAGFSLVVPDLPGYGQTPGKAGVGSLEAHLSVIDETVKLMASQTKDLPLFLFGHSMGGNIALNYLLNQEEQLDADGSVRFQANPNNVFHAAIITSPWLKLRRNYPEFLMKIVRFIGGLMPNATTNSRLKLEQLCNDHKVLQDREQDKFCNDRISYKLLSDMWQSGKRAKAYANQLHLPLLLMYGTDDQIVSAPEIQELAQHLPSYMNPVAFDGFMHEIHNMQERELVYQTMLEFLSLCIKRGNVPVPELEIEPLIPANEQAVTNEEEQKTAEVTEVEVEVSALEEVEDVPEE